MSTGLQRSRAAEQARHVTPAVAIAGCGLWLPGRPSWAAFCASNGNGAARHGAACATADAATAAPAAPAAAAASAATAAAADAAADADRPQGTGLGRMNRRRASQLGRALADVGFEAMAHAAVDPAGVRSVIGSSIAEVSTMLGILEQIWRTREPVSPAAFTVSVHNAASGLLSIATGNRGFTTSLAADADTPAVALLEGMAVVLCTGQPVLVACGDESSPADLVPSGQQWGLAAAAVVLAPLGPGAAPRATLRLVRPARADLPPAAVDEVVARNPQIGLVDLLDALARGRRGTVALDRGSGQGWCAEIEPTAGP
jgi:hypothetical protein